MKTNLKNHTYYNKKIIIHADDLGISNEITDNIIYCINHGLVTSTSIVCNTLGFEYAIEKYSANPKPFALRLHINLVEGYPVTSRENITLLINKNGEFRYSFFSLWIKYIFSSQKTKCALIYQIKTEIVNQISKFKTALKPGTTFGIDSHTHVHMIPIILKILSKLSDSEPISFIRLPRERFYFSIKNIKNYCSLNIIKHIVLNLLCIGKYSRLEKLGISSNTSFIGVLATGRMTISSVCSALKGIKKSGTVEILFHPGGIDKIDSVNWTNKKKFKGYYTSVYRKKETAALTGAKLKKQIKHYGKL